MLIDASKVESPTDAVPADAQSGQVTEKLTFKSKCVSSADGGQVCVEENSPLTAEKDPFGRPTTDAQKLQPPSKLCRTGSIVYNRQEVCAASQVTITNYSSKRVVLGTAVGIAYVYQYGVRNQTTLANQLSWTTVRTTGTGSNFSFAGNTPKCVGKCSRTGALTSLTGKRLQVGKTLTAQSFYKWTGTKTRTYQDMTWAVAFRHTNTKTIAPLDLKTKLSFRCDRESRSASPGCVVPRAIVTVGFKKVNYPQFARHVSLAQASGLPGATTPLNRLKDGQDGNKNRTKACPSRLNRNGLDCDEYPFASTQQGAYYGGGSGRTFSNCNISDKAYPLGVRGSKGYSACMIDRTQNRSAGTDLSTVFSASHILTGDPFYVGIR